MSETYTVKASMPFETNAPIVLAEITKQLRSVNDLLKGSIGGFQKFTTQMKELASATRGAGGGFMGDMERMATLSREMAVSQKEMAASTRATATAMREAAGAMAKAGGGGGSRKGRSAGGGGFTHGDAMNAALGLQMGGDMGVDFLGKAVMANFEVEHLLTQFRQNNQINDGDMAAIRSKAEGLARSVPGTTIAENLHTILDAYTVTGNIAEAMSASGAMAKLGLVLSSLPGAQGKDPGFAAAQAVEVMQRFYNPQTHQVDMGAMNAQISAMAQVAVGTGGRADPSKYLAFAKQARMGGMLANDDFLYGDLPAMLISLGGSRAGTGDAAIFRQFMQGRMTKNAFTDLQKTGLIDRGATWAHGQVQDMMKHLMGAGGFVANPVQWTRDTLLPQLGRSGVNVNDRASLGLAIGQWASTAPGLGFLAEMALGMPGINKERAKIGSTSNDPMKAILANDPMQQMRVFAAAENELLVTLGGAMMGPAIDSLKALTSVLHDLSDWSKAHPGAAKDILVTSAGLAVFSKAAGDLAMVVFLGSPLVRGMGALAAAATPFAAAGAAGVGLMGVASGLTALAAAVIGLPQVLKYITDMLPSGTPTGGRAAPAHVFGGYSGPRGVQTGTNQFDGSMHPYPAGAPAGGGN